jgi:ribosome-associated protein
MIGGGMREIEVRGQMIRLGQLLKVAGLVDSGGEAKALLADGSVTVNGDPETRRGRQLHDGDVVAAGDESVRVVAGGS